MREIKVDDIRIDELKIFNELSERQLKRYFEPEPGLFVAETAKVIERVLKAGYELQVVLAEEEMIKGENKILIDAMNSNPELENVNIYLASHEELVGITGYELTRGLLAAFRRRKMPELSELCEGKRRIVVLKDVMNPTNVGAIFRNAAALGAEAVIVTDSSADPLYRRALRVSMGTVFQIPWTYINVEEDGVNSILHQMGFKTVAMALKEDALDIADGKLSEIDKLAIILGTEGDGLSNKVIEGCDYTVIIPMYNDVDSLNVAAASAVALYQLCKK